MKVLILSQYFAPEPAEKIVDEATGLKQRGHDVEVLTSFPCYPLGKIYDGFRQRLTKRELYDDVPIIRVPQFPDHSRSAIRRAIYYLSFAFSAMFIGIWRVKRADVMLVYQSAIPTGIAAWWISRLRGIPYMLDVVDLWPESVVASGMLRNRFLISMIRAVSRFVYLRADHVSVITEGYRDRLIEMGVPADRISVIYHWKRPELYGVTTVDDKFAEEEDLSNSFNVVYAGNIGPCQSLETVLECAEQLKDQVPDVCFVLVGDGLDRERLQDMATTKQLSNVRFLGRRPQEQMAPLSALAAAMLVHLERSPMADVSIPSKTIGYLGCGRPILMGVAGEATRLVERHQCGVAFEPKNANSLADAVLKMYHASPDEREHWSTAGLAAYEENFNPQRQLDKMTIELTRLVHARAA